jgi:hypothetical protein
MTAMSKVKEAALLKQGREASRSRSAMAAGPRPVRKYPPLCAAAELRSSWQTTTQIGLIWRAAIYPTADLPPVVTV